MQYSLMKTSNYISQTDMDIIHVLILKIVIIWQMSTVDSVQYTQRQLMHVQSSLLIQAPWIGINDMTRLMLCGAYSNCVPLYCS